MLANAVAEGSRTVAVALGEGGGGEAGRRGGGARGDGGGGGGIFLLLRTISYFISGI